MNNMLENRISTLEKKIEPHGDLELILSNLLIYSKKHKGWVITRESITNFDIDYFAKCYTVWVGYNDLIDSDTIDLEADYISTKDIELMLKADALDYFIGWLSDNEVINIDIKSYKNSKKTFKGIVPEKDIVQLQHYKNIEKSNEKIVKLTGD